MPGITGPCVMSEFPNTGPTSVGLSFEAGAVTSTYMHRFMGTRDRDLFKRCPLDDRSGSKIVVQICTEPQSGHFKTAVAGGEN